MDEIPHARSRCGGGVGELIEVMGRSAVWFVFLLLLLVQGGVFTSKAALPKRLILAVDGIAYHDMKALQEGIAYQDRKGRWVHRQAFHEGYFPVSRLVSTFPSASDVAWTEMFGNRPLPGYQRTHFSKAANTLIYVNGVTSTIEFERQMTWRRKGGFRHAMSYLFPRSSFRREVHNLAENFLKAINSNDEHYYAYLCSTDDAQHMSCDIRELLCTLDAELQELRARYRAREGRELEVLILSDHGNDHAGPGKRVQVRRFLKAAGYRVAESIRSPADVVLPTVGMQSWVEIHNAPEATAELLQLLTHLEGVDLLTAPVPGRTNQFILLNSQGKRALIDWDAGRNSFRYSVQTGDPIFYQPVMEILSRQHRLSPEGFATADDWMDATLTHRYPLALERIVQGHTRITLNPASILISLKNGYVHADWFIKAGGDLMKCGGTHGALDDQSSNGIVLSSFAPTQDTSTSRVAAQYGNFPGLRDFRTEESGAEWISGDTRAFPALARTPFDCNLPRLPDEKVLLRIWTPQFARLTARVPIEVVIQKIPPFLSAPVRRGDPKPAGAHEQLFMLPLPMTFAEQRPYERIYPLPPQLRLEPQKQYRISGRVRDGTTSAPLFKFAFHTDHLGLPAAY
ncbi:MAG TPA: hypothetical protein VEC99_08370 [Clostridia bacterium]|nr:hypothetical protein [Clostridia bacterium]